MTEEYLRTTVIPRFSRVLVRDQIYLANHSLGRPLNRTADDVRRALDLWFTQMDDAWAPWVEETNAWRAGIARLIGVAAGDRIVPKTSAGQGLRAVLNAFPQGRRVPVVTTRGEFDSIDFILKAYEHAGRAAVKWVDPDTREGEVPIYTVEPLIEAMTGEPGLVVVSLAFFGTSQILQRPEKLIAAARERGWLVMLDVYHAAGVIPLELDALGADFAIGGSYKYLRGGPGACYLALGNRELPTNFRSLDTGWFAKKNTFGYERSNTPEFAEGGDGWLESTPAVLAPFQAKAGLAFALEIGIANLRETSLRLQATMRNAFRKAGAPLFEPKDPHAFGAFSLLYHDNAHEFSAALKEQGVNTDARGRFVRFGPDLLNAEEELRRAAEIVSLVRL